MPIFYHFNLKAPYGGVSTFLSLLLCFFWGLGGASAQHNPSKKRNPKTVAAAVAKVDVFIVNKDNTPLSGSVCIQKTGESNTKEEVFVAKIVVPDPALNSIGYSVSIKSEGYKPTLLLSKDIVAGQTVQMEGIFDKEREAFEKRLAEEKKRFEDAATAHKAALEIMKHEYDLALASKDRTIEQIKEEYSKNLEKLHNVNNCYNQRRAKFEEDMEAYKRKVFKNKEDRPVAPKPEDCNNINTPPAPPTPPVKPDYTITNLRKWEDTDKPTAELAKWRTLVGKINITDTAFLPKKNQKIVLYVSIFDEKHSKYLTQSDISNQHPKDANKAKIVLKQEVTPTNYDFRFSVRDDYNYYIRHKEAHRSKRYTIQLYDKDLKEIPNTEIKFSFPD